MKKLLIVLAALTTFFGSCKKQDIQPEVCPDGCNSEYIVSSPNATLQPDGYWHVKYIGANYFKVSGTASKLNPQFETNGVPLIEANFDSDYWILFDTIKYQTPMYSYLGWFNNQQFNTPIAIGTHTYTLKNAADLHPPLNMAGYQINKNICWTCPYTPTLFGTHSKYNYTPSQTFFLDNEMVGDTANIYIQTIFNSDVGPSETKNTVLKVIFE